MSIFGPSLGELTLEDVEQYLSRADTEPLLWEAKGTGDRGESTRPDAKTVREQVCGFANSHEGGYLILGASRRDGRWVCDGVAFPDKEPETWVVNVIADPTYGIKPRPDVDFSRAFATTEGRTLLVVKIAPATTPPCICNGTVFERLPGQTPRVSDPQRLAELFARGDAARREARARADRAAVTLLDTWVRDGARLLFDRTDGEDLAVLGDEAGPDDCVRIVLAVAATGYRPDIASRLFQDSLVQDLWNELRELGREPGLPIDPELRPVDITQDAATWWSRQQHPRPRIAVVRATWDGAVAVGRVTAPGSRYPTHLIERLESEWAIADRVARTSLGGSGSMYLTVIAQGRRLMGPSVPEAPVVMRRGPLDPGVHRSVLDGLGRELSRAVGNPELEPPPG